MEAVSEENAYSVLALDLDHHVAIFNLHGIDCDPGVGIVRGLAGLGIPLPAVPWTDELVAFDDPLTKRTATMQAVIIHRGDGSVHVGHADDFVAAGEFFGFALGGKIGLGKNEHLAVGA
jgi:hypothetical protein